jgi:mannose-6-phosphate isomerase-like protein (cupin superfamily)
MPPDWLVPSAARPEHPTGERCHITELLNLAAEPGVSLATARVAPGVTTRLHALDGIVERYVVLKGEGLAEIGGEWAELRAGDVAIIPAGVPQRISNTGAVDLVFHCVCTPRFTAERYRDLGE